MSVVLNALRAQKEEEKKKEGELSADEGLSLGHDGFSLDKKVSGGPKKRVLILLLLFVGVSIFTLYSWMFKDSFGPQNTQQAQQNFETVDFASKRQQRSQVQQDKASSLFAAGRYDQSLGLYKKELEANDSALVRANLGLVYLKKSMFDQAEEHFQKALELDSRCARCWNHLGYLRSLQGDDGEALRLLKRAVQLQPRLSDAHFNLGVLHEKQSQISESVEHYELFVETATDEQKNLANRVSDRLKEITGQ